MKNIILFASILRIVLISTIICFAIYANAQNVAINTTGNSADGSAMLDVSSTTKGFLPPRMTTIQRTGIPSPVNGLMVFDSDTKTYWYFSTTWKEITNAGGSFSLPYTGAASDAGKLFSVSNSAIVAGSTAIYGRGSTSGSGIFTGFSMGVWGDNSIGVGIMGTSSNIGVLGASGNATEGIGVMGTSSSTQFDRGAVTGINNASGVGVYGRSIGTDGISIYGIAGQNSSSSKAAFFTNTNSANTRPVVEITNNGLSNNSLYIHNSNATATGSLFRIMNIGTGSFLQFQDAAQNTIFNVAKNGNVATDGNIYAQGNLYVDGLKGIVRNTYSNQMRIETMNVNIPADTYNHYDSDWGPGGQEVNVVFSTAFASPPAVYFGNWVSGSTVSGMSIEVYNVTTTGCTIHIGNYGPYNLPRGACVYKVIAIGND